MSLEHLFDSRTSLQNTYNRTIWSLNHRSSDFEIAISFFCCSLCVLRGPDPLWGDLCTQGDLTLTIGPAPYWLYLLNLFSVDFSTK